ncbi:MAG: hypothetical protein M1839_002151 [Geoglossum umbratile]|nr:MAG: hypothetical protein M1839_002151 [Geoglossum umbratile]
MSSTYLDIKSVNYLINAITPDSLEGPVQSAWANILGKGRFFNEDSYAIETNRQRETQYPDVIVIQIIEFPAGIAPVDILMVECKRPRRNATVWHFDELANAQLDCQLTETPNASGFVFGAAAIGREVRFYEKFDKQEPVPLHNGVYDILTNARDVEWWLDYMMRTGPRW